MKRLLLVALILLTGAVFAAGQAKVTLKALFYSPELTDQYNAMAAQYQKETGVTLDITVNQSDYPALLRAKLNSGDVPDLFMSSAYSDNATYKDYLYDLTETDFIRNLQPDALAGVTLNGRITGYPFLVQSYSFIYNKDVFKAAGITVPPRTLAEYEAAARRLQSRGIQPFATGYKEWWVLPQTAWQVLASAASSHGGYAAFVARLNDGRQQFKTMKEMSSVFDLLDLVKKYGGPKPMESDFNDQCSQLANGTVGMAHQGTWAESSILKTNPRARIGFLLGPAAGPASQSGIMYDSNQTIRVARDGQVPAALAWLRWLTTSAYGKAWIPDVVQQLSPINGAPAPSTQLAQATVALRGARTPAYPWFYQMFPTGLEEGLGLVLQGYCAGQTSRAQTLDALDAEYTKMANASR